MSEFINNREYRQKVLKELIMELHHGKSVEEVKERFAQLIEGISASEISEMESALMMEGMPVEEVQRLCDVHAAVFKGSIEDIHKPQEAEETPGHPIHTMKLENIEIDKLVKNHIMPHIDALKQDDNKQNRDALLDDFIKLWEIDKHYLRKENLLFPYLEKYGINGPPKVMWGVDDEIRNAIKEVRAHLEEGKDLDKYFFDSASEVANRVIEMIFKEEKILMPMSVDTLSEDEWKKIEHESEELGYTLITQVAKWKPERVNMDQKLETEGEIPQNSGSVSFDAGMMTPEEINALLNTLPFDLTFVDKDGLVKYFSQGPERIFPRTKAVLGRTVSNCHPPASVHIVEAIVEDLQSGKKDHEDFWINKGGMFVYIRYFAVRNRKGEFLGVVECSQNVKTIRELEGEKRLVSFND